jgi:hypothetical protein
MRSAAVCVFVLASCSSQAPDPSSLTVTVKEEGRRLAGRYLSTRGSELEFRIERTPAEHFIIVTSSGRVLVRQRTAAEAPEELTTLHVLDVDVLADESRTRTALGTEEGFQRWLDAVELFAVLMAAPEHADVEPTRFEVGADVVQELESWDVSLGRGVGEDGRP